MKSDTELEMWRRQWQSQPQVPIDLIRKVERQTVSMRDYRIAEILVTILMGGGTIIAAVITRNSNVAILAIGTAIAIILAWRFTLKHTRGLWSPGAPTTAAYLDLAVRRCRWRIADARYDTIQSVLLTLFVFFIDYRLIVETGRWSGPADALGFWVLCLAICLLLVSAFAKKRRKAKTELAYLSELQAQLSEVPSVRR